MLAPDASSPAPKPLGRPRLFAAWHRLWLRVEKDEHTDLKAIAAEEGKTVTDVVRDAVNEYVGDFRERVVFAGRHKAECCPHCQGRGRVLATRSRHQANRARRGGARAAAEAIAQAALQRGIPQAAARAGRIRVPS